MINREKHPYDGYVIAAKTIQEVITAILDKAKEHKEKVETVHIKYDGHFKSYCGMSKYRRSL